jgi:hypothetical protein
MPERQKSNQTNSSKLDEIVDQYLQRSKPADDEKSFYSDEESNSENYATDCRFKDNCYALKFNMGACPCELKA